MPQKILPFSKKQIENIIKDYPTPFHIYDEKAIRDNARAFINAFNWNEGFKEFFAVKAAPNPYLMKILHKEGYGADCSSLAELMMAQKTGITGEEIMFSSNDTPVEDFLLAKKLKAIINLDDISHIAFLEKSAGLPALICFRYNPGKLKKAIILSATRKKPNTVSPANSFLKAIKYAGTRAFGVSAFIRWSLQTNLTLIILWKPRKYCST